MRSKTRTLIVSLCMLASSAAMANDAVWGALLGGGAGAAIGGSVSGRDGAIVGGAIGAAAGAVIASENDRQRVVYTPDVHYRPRTVYYAAPQVYYAPPPRIVTPVYYVPTYRGNRHDHLHRHDWHRDEGHWRGYR